MLTANLPREVQRHIFSKEVKGNAFSIRRILPFKSNIHFYPQLQGVYEFKLEMLVREETIEFSKHLRIVR